MKEGSSVQTRLMIAAMILLIGATVVGSYLALGSFEREFKPAMEKKASAVGSSVNKLMTKMVDYGVPLSKLRGMDAIFDSVTKENPDIAYLALKDESGKVLFDHWGASVENARKSTKAGLYLSTQKVRGPGGAAEGSIVVGADKEYMQHQMDEIITDIVTVLVVSGLMAAELLLFLNTFMVSAPLEGIRKTMRRVRNGDFSAVIENQSGDQVGRFGALINRAIMRVDEIYHHHKPSGWAEKFSFAERGTLAGQFSEKLLYIRPPLFLLIFSESMSLSFFPIYVESLYTPIADLPKSVVIGLPISLFMLIWALSLPFAGQWSDRAGRRRSFLVGALITAVGLVLTGLANDMLQLLIYRSLTAVGYGIVFISAQGYVTDHTTAKNRTKGMALFLSGFFSGSLCGAAIGGILADRIGYHATFFLSAFLSVASALFVYRFLVERRRDPDAVPRKLSFADFKSLLGDKYFLTITFLSAIPAKMALTGFLYYAGPLYLGHLGASQSSAGRILMAYGLAIILVSPVSAWIADKMGRRQLFITVGGLMAGGSLLVVHFVDNIWGMLGGVAMLGVAHAIGVSPQLSLVTQFQQRSGSTTALGTTIGIFRLTERIGNIAGPIIAGALITVFGYSGAFLGMGIGAVVCVILFTILMWLFNWLDGRQDRAGVATA